MDQVHIYASSFQICIPGNPEQSLLPTSAWQDWEGLGSYQLAFEALLRVRGSGGSRKNAFSVSLGQECHPGAFLFILNNLLQPIPRKIMGSLQCQPNQHGRNCFGWEPSCEARPAQDAPYLSYWSIAPPTTNKFEQLLTPKLCDQRFCLMFQFGFCFKH